MQAKVSVRKGRYNNINSSNLKDMMYNNILYVMSKLAKEKLDKVDNIEYTDFSEFIIGRVREIDMITRQINIDFIDGFNVTEDMEVYLENVGIRGNMPIFFIDVKGGNL